MEPGKKRSRPASTSKRRGRKSTSSNINRSSTIQQKNIHVNDKLVLYLNEILSMENASLERLQSRIMETTLADLKVQLQRHLEETRKQQNRLRKLVVALGGKPTEDKAQLSVPSGPQSISNVLRESKLEAESELMKTKEDALLENAEIMYYDILLQIVRKAGAVETIHPLTQNMNEEISMAYWLKSNIESVITRSQLDVADSTIVRHA
jgi:ferritin-like metal-binding protein YciE